MVSCITTQREISSSRTSADGDYSMSEKEQKTIDTQIGDRMKSLIGKHLEVNNIVRFSSEPIGKPEQKLAVIYFHAADGKVYQKQVPQEQLTPDKVAKLEKLQSVTFIGVLPVTNRENHFYFMDYDQSTMVYRK